MKATKSIWGLRLVGTGGMGCREHYLKADERTTVDTENPA